MSVVYCVLNWDGGCGVLGTSVDVAWVGVCCVVWCVILELFVWWWQCFGGGVEEVRGVCCLLSECFVTGSGGGIGVCCCLLSEPAVAVCL